jgi:hypothetical protein
MRADMSDELPDESLINLAPPSFDFMPDDKRIARMGAELATLRRVLLVLVEDRPDLLRLLGHSHVGTTQDRP